MRLMAVSPLPVVPANMATGNRRASGLQSIGLRKKSEITIVLDGKDDFVHSYSTFDEIKGHARICFEKDTPIDSLNITFQGQTNTWVEKMTTVSPRAGRATAKHVFLRLHQPIDSNPFPEDNVAKEGITYTIPFNFVVPEKVLPFICNHSVKDEHVRSQHCYLPPSIGEEMLAGEGSVLMDDLCPSMAKIVYSIKVDIVTSDKREQIYNLLGIRIIPARPELIAETDLPYRDGCVQYHLRKEKNVRKGILKLGRKQGRLTAETSQPRSLKLPHQQAQFKEAVATTATINLRYDPASLEEEPPQLTSIDTRLRGFTFFGAAPFRHLVGPMDFDVYSLTHGQYSLSVDLSTMNLRSVRWTKHEPEGPFAERERHASVATTASSTRASSRKMSTSTGTASIGAPARNSILKRTTSDLSQLSAESCSPASSTTTLSTPVSPTMSGSDGSLRRVAGIAPSKTYDQTLPYYTTSVVVPISLPSTHSNSPSMTLEESFSRRSSSATADQSTSDPNLRRGSVDRAGTVISSGTSTTFSRKRGIPTFLPSFHSCLVARTYALELTLHAANPAPRISLRTPIQIVSEPSPNQPPHSSTTQEQPPPPPLAWYDPFDLAAATSAQNVDEQDTLNDEAIARALASQPHHHYNHNSSFHQIDDQVPAYADLHIQTSTTTNNIASPHYYSSIAEEEGEAYSNDYSTTTTIQAPPKRHNSAPLTTSSSHLTTATASSILPAIIPPRANESDLPPEYNATLGFRRRQSTPLIHTRPAAAREPSVPAESSTRRRPSAPIPSQRRRESTGWTKKLGLRI